MLLTERAVLLVGAGVATVREPERPYEDEGSTREARGAVSLPGGAWWSAVLRVPMHDAAAPGMPAVQLQLSRHAAPGEDAAHSVRAELLVPAGEVGDVARLLAGVVTQARRDAVLPPPPDR